MNGKPITRAAHMETTGAPLAKPRAAVLASIVLCLGGLAGLLASELAVRIFAPQALISDVIVGDPDVDYRLRPNARGHMSSPEYSADIRINALGFRGPEISAAKKPGVVRVLFLGDSFTFGHGLGENETLPFQVGQELERRRPGKFEVVNGGVYGYSTTEELNLFKKFGVPLKPDIVVTLLMTNDLADNVTGNRLGNDGKLLKQTVSSDYTRSRRITRFIPGANALRGHSHLFKFIGVRVLPILTSGKLPITDNADPTQAADAAGAVPPEFQRAFYEEKAGPFEVTKAILVELARTANENGARCVLLTLGGAYEFRNGKLKPEAMLFHDRMADAALRSGFSATLAVSPILAEYKGGEVLFFPKDTHWTGAATKFVAPAAAEVIARTAGPRS